MQKTKSVTVSDSQYAIFNRTEYAVLIFLNKYAELDRKLDTPYPMEVDRPVWNMADMAYPKSWIHPIGGYNVLDLVSFVVFGECRHRYAVSSLMDTAYWLSEQPSHNHDAPEFKEFFIINELQAQLKARNVSIEKLKEHIANIKGKNVVEKQYGYAYVNYLKHIQENADTLREIIKHTIELRPLDSNLDSAYKFVTQIQELLVYVNETCSSTKSASNKLVAVTPMNKTRKVSSTEAYGSKPRSNTKKDKISQISCSNKNTNKVEADLRIAKSSLNNTNRVSKIVCNENVKHFVLNATSKLVCATCHECMFDAIHDLCVSGYLNDVNARVKPNSGLVQNPIPQPPYVPPIKNDWDILFQPMFDEFFNPPLSVVSLVPFVSALRPVVPTGSPVSTSIDQDAPSTSNPSTQEQEKSLIIFQGVEESAKTPHFHDDPLHKTLHEESTSQGSSSNVR
ncbi:hypothetical protein Tco_0662131 [Tanacetum coccineum]